MKRSSIFTLLLCGAAALPAFADDHPPVLDKVTFTLEAEDWVPTTTAKVSAEIDATLQGADAGKVRGDMMKAVASLAGDADWKFAAFDRSQDQSGLETWHATLEARLKETALGGLADKAKQASHPGLQVKIAGIEFTPSLAESQAVKGRLRSQIYGMVRDELKRLNDADPGRDYRIGEIEFDTAEIHPLPMMRPGRMGVAMAAPAIVNADNEPVTVQQKAALSANVTLEASAPKDAQASK